MSADNNLKIGERMITISRRLMTILAYFCIAELGSSKSRMTASIINRMIFAIHSVKKDMPPPSYRTIMVMFPAAIMTVILKKNINETMASAAKI
jgi:hypothetical protein